MSYPEGKALSIVKVNLWGGSLHFREVTGWGARYGRDLVTKLWVHQLGVLELAT